MSKVFTGHTPWFFDHGLDILLHVHDDGTYEVALREGKDVRWMTWSMPIEMTEEKPQ